jgi:hypothetical protein
VTPEAILIPCEGSGGFGHEGPDIWHRICAMCGQSVSIAIGVDGKYRIGLHQRDDVLARIERGDFG